MPNTQHVRYAAAPGSLFTAFYASHGIAIRQVMSDTAWSHRRSNDFQSVITALGATHIPVITVFQRTVLIFASRDGIAKDRRPNLYDSWPRRPFDYLIID